MSAQLSSQRNLQQHERPRSGTSQIRLSDNTDKKINKGVNNEVPTLQVSQKRPTHSARSQRGPNFKLSFVDFRPAMLKQAGTFSSPKYERFDALVRHANEWLMKNPGIKVKTCESIEVKSQVDKPDLDSVKSTYTEWRAMCYVRCLRVWIVPKEHSDGPHPQQLGYINMVPVCTESGGIINHPRFESFRETMQRLNKKLVNSPLQGKILNIETQDVKFKTWSKDVDPEVCYWSEGAKETVFNLNVIRIFYEVGARATSEDHIGYVDFVPSKTKSSSFKNQISFEPLNVVLMKARQWAQSQPNIGVVNLQSIDYKLKESWGGGSLNTERSMYFESGQGFTYYVRIIRVYFLQSHTGNVETAEDMPRKLTCHTFLPYKTTESSALKECKFETQMETKKRANAWLVVTGAKVVCVETPTLRMLSADDPGHPERTYTFNQSNRPERMMHIIRVYLDGEYKEPPPDSLPPPPEITANTSASSSCQIL